MAEAALAWAEAGFHVFPCEATNYDPRKAKWSKRPHRMLAQLSAAHGEGGWKLATRESDQIREWWEHDPTALIGVPPGLSRALVLDVDGPDGVRQLYDRAEEFDLYTTFQSRTPGDGGGLHVWFLRPLGSEVVIGNGRLSHIRGEARADRGYVIVPPSVLPDGGAYEVASHTNVLSIYPEWVAFELPFERPGDRVGITEITTGEQAEWMDRHSAAARVVGDSASGVRVVEEALSSLRSAVIGDEQLGRDPTMKHWVGKLITSVQKGMVSVDLSAALGEIREAFIDVKPEGGPDFDRFVSDALALRVAEDRSGFIELSDVPTWDEDRWFKADQAHASSSGSATRVSGTAGTGGIPLPPGLRLYEPGDLAGVIPPPDEAVLIGPLGEWMKGVEPETEASLASLGAGALTGLSAWYGRDFILKVGELKHPLRLFAVQVGPTAKARKGTADSVVWELMSAIDLDFTQKHVISGFGSGEALIERVSDERRDAAGNVVSGNKDQRMWVVEGEFSKLLRVANREGSILSDVIRLAYDGRMPLENHTKGKRLRSSAHALGLFGGITPEELTDQMTVLGAASGFGNRFLWVWSSSEKNLPDGGRMIPPSAVGRDIRVAREGLKGVSVLGRTEEAADWWRAMYPDLRNLVGIAPEVMGMTSRLTDLCQRIAAIYALTEGARHVSVRHMEAGLAWVNHSVATVTVVLGGLTANPIATKLLNSLRSHPGVPASMREIHRVFSQHETAYTIRSALLDLENAGLAYTWQAESTGGRPGEQSIATMPADQGKRELSSFSASGGSPEGEKSPEDFVRKTGEKRLFAPPIKNRGNPQSVTGREQREQSHDTRATLSAEKEQSPEEAPTGTDEEAPARGYGLDVTLTPTEPLPTPAVRRKSLDTRVSDMPPAPSDLNSCPKCRIGHVSPSADNIARCQAPGCGFAAPTFIWNKELRKRKEARENSPPPH